jgi:hypothetical protein
MRLDALEERLDSTRSALDNADRELRLLASSRTWRIAWGAHIVRRRLVRVGADPASDPLQRVRDVIHGAKRQLAAEMVTTPTDPQGVRRDDGRE